MCAFYYCFIPPNVAIHMAFSFAEHSMEASRLFSFGISSFLVFQFIFSFPGTGTQAKKSDITRHPDFQASTVQISSTSEQLKYTRIC